MHCALIWQTGSDHATWKTATVLVKIIIGYIFKVISNSLLTKVDRCTRPTRTSYDFDKV